LKEPSYTPSAWIPIRSSESSATVAETPLPQVAISSLGGRSGSIPESRRIA
jgi:hypothetical protein